MLKAAQLEQQGIADIEGIVQKTPEFLEVKIAASRRLVAAQLLVDPQSPAWQEHLERMTELRAYMETRRELDATKAAIALSDYAVAKARFEVDTQSGRYPWQGGDPKSSKFKSNRPPPGCNLFARNWRARTVTRSRAKIRTEEANIAQLRSHLSFVQGRLVAAEPATAATAPAVAESPVTISTIQDENSSKQQQPSNLFAHRRAGRTTKLFKIESSSRKPGSNWLKRN